MEQLVQKTFRYNPLVASDSIRLLVLEPGQPGSAINVRLVYTTLEDCRNEIHDQYTALSYVWGNAKDQKLIMLEGHPFSVTMNLADALEDLRHKEKPFLIWIDAICIDQTNISERNFQVGLMKEIYGLAQQSIVYLGASNSNSEATFVALKDHAKNLQVVPQNVRDDAIDDFLSRTWWTRIWIYQELLLPQRIWVQAGRNRIDWEDLRTALLGQQKHKDVLPSDGSLSGTREQTFSTFYHMQRARQRFHLSLLGGGEAMDIFDVLLTRRGFGVTDVRDMIYGHLGICNHPNPEFSTNVDYGKSVAQVFTDASAYIINSTGRRDLIFEQHLRDQLKRRELLPSWVVDWTLPSPSYLAPITFTQLQISRHFNWKLGSSSLRALATRTMFFEDESLSAFQSTTMGKVVHMTRTLKSWKEEKAMGSKDPPQYVIPTNVMEGDGDNYANSQIGLRKLGLDDQYLEFYNIWQSNLGDDQFPLLPPFAPGTRLWRENYTEIAIEASRFKGLKKKEQITDWTPKAPKILLEALMWYAFGVHGTEYLEGRRIATLETPKSDRSPRIAIVPAETEVGDEVIMAFVHAADKYSSHSAVLRSYDSSDLPDLSERLRAKIPEAILEKCTLPPVSHHTLVGASYLFGANDTMEVGPEKMVVLH